MAAELTAPLYSLELLGEASMVSMRVGGELVSIKTGKDYTAEIGQPRFRSIPAQPAITSFDRSTGARIAARWRECLSKQPRNRHASAATDFAARLRAQGLVLSRRGSRRASMVLPTGSMKASPGWRETFPADSATMTMLADSLDHRSRSSACATAR